MILKAGTRLGHYEVLSLIGKGGMGEVYRAKDHKLQREVALKVLPEAFARDPERVARFRREAQVLASLNHPNIAAIYGLEDANGLHFLVLELVEGETLAGMIRDSGLGVRGSGGGIPVEEAVRICGQICEALEAAHEKTVVHRDLKPANVKVTPEGKVKVLDFGLAKAFGEESGVVSPDAPTALSATPTMPGTILGTAAYMSPEQARGKKVDRRTDIWALGCVLYELLTGKQTFAGESVTDILGAVLHKEPEWAALPAETPASLRTVLRRCLEKDATRRFRDAADVKIQMEEGLAAPVMPAPGTASVVASKPWRRALPWGLAFLAGAIVAGVALWILRPVSTSTPATVSVTRLSLSLPPAEQLANTTAPIVAFSPDGALLAYVSGKGGVSQLYLRPLESLEAKAIPGTEGAVGPFFSPDGNWIGFFANGKLKKVSIGGGVPVILANAPAPSGGAWISNDTIVFAPQTVSGLRKISAAGGMPEVLTTPDPKKEEGRHVWPEFLADGKAVLFTVSVPAAEGGNQIVSLSLENGERKMLIQGGGGARYARSGHLVYGRGGTLMAVPFDIKRLEVLGSPVPVVESVMLSSFGLAQFAISGNGTLVYAPGGQEEGTLKLVWVDRKGNPQPLPAPARYYTRPRLSPEGERVAVDLQGANRDVWLYDIQRDTLTRLTFEADNSSPVWTPDGKKVAYRSTKGGPANLYWKTADGTGAEERLVSSDNTLTPLSFSTDGKFLAYYETAPKSGSDLWVVPTEGEHKPRLFLQTPFNEASPMFSPDGGWIAYVSDESGRSEIYARPFPGPGGKWQISTEGGTEPLWARNGKELFYRNGDKMMAVDIGAEPSLAAGKPRLLFEGSYQSGSASGRTTYDISPDGQRFLLVMSAEQEEGSTQLNIVQNWFEELKRRVPVGQ